MAPRPTHRAGAPARQAGRWLAATAAAAVTVIAVSSPWWHDDSRVAALAGAYPAALGAPRLIAPASQPADEPTARRREPIARASVFDATAHSLTDPGSQWVIVNKQHPIEPLDFVPHLALVRGYQVAKAAARPLAQLLAAAEAAGLQPKVASAYRSYDYQVRVHDSLAATEGDLAADRYSARAGYSEHQTGLAVDLTSLTDDSCSLQPCFAQTPEGRWLRERAAAYGFLVRYTRANESVTGYAPEPWHLRYVGRGLVAAMGAAEVTTLEEFFDVSGGDYPPG